MSEIVAKYVAGQRATHNRDGKYTVAWRLWSDGRVERTNSRSQYRPVRRGETLPRAIIEAARQHGIALAVDSEADRIEN